MWTSAKAPGKPALLSAAMQPGRRERLAQPQGCARDQAIWEWLGQDYGVPLADKPVPKVVRYTRRAKLKVPRKSQIKTP
jgi:hypothetical protein